MRLSDGVKQIDLSIIEDGVRFFASEFRHQKMDAFLEEVYNLTDRVRAIVHCWNTNSLTLHNNCGGMEADLICAFFDRIKYNQFKCGGGHGLEEDDKL